MSSFLEKRLAANRQLISAQDQEVANKLPSVAPRQDLIANMTAQMAAPIRDDLEELPRRTVLRMLGETELGEDFTFKVQLGEGTNYVQAMRQVLSRARNKAKASKRILEDFKLYEKSIESKEDHDVVTLVRSIPMSGQEKSVYDELMGKMELKLTPRK